MAEVAVMEEPQHAAGEMPAEASGTVKSFNPTKGYGFIVSEEVEGDIYFQDRDVPAHLRGPGVDLGTDLVGKSVFFRVSPGAKDGKPQAKGLQVQRNEGDPCMGEVKSFVEQKGFGFITSQDVEGDVYFQNRDLPPQFQGQGAQLKGMKVRFSPHVMPDGKYQGRQISLLNAPPVAAGPPAWHAPQYAPPPPPPAPHHVPKGAAAYGKGMPADPWGKGDGWGKGDPWGKGGDPYGKGGQYIWAPSSGKGKDMDKGCKGVGPWANGGGKRFEKGFKGALPQAGEEGSAMRGIVKSFVTDKGYGFITADGVQGDIYFKAAEPVEKGSEVSFFVKYMPDGKAQAHDLAYALNGGEVVVGTVKSYNGKSGYGFIAVDDYPQDVYCRRQDLPEELQALDSDSLVGVQLQFTVNITRDGKPQVKDAAQMVAPQPAGLKRSAASFAAPPDKRPRPTFTAGGPFAPAAAPSQAVKGKGFYAAPPPPAAYAPPPAPGGCKGGKSGGKFEDGGTGEGVVKSYNSTKGFGFIESAITGGVGDVYFQRVALPMESQQEQLNGAQVSFQVAWTPDGKAQAQSIQILGW